MRAVTEEVASSGHRAFAVVCDVANGVAAMVGQTLDTFGRLDMAFNSAGIAGPLGPFADESWSARPRPGAFEVPGTPSPGRVDVVAEERFVDIVAEGYDAGVRLTEAIERDMVEVRS